MQALPALSFVVPAYEASRTIGALVESIVRDPAFAATDEVVVVDDGSRDDTAQVARAAGAKLIRLPSNRGPAAARNAGVRAAQHSIIVFADADTRFEPGTIGAIRAHFATPGAQPCLNGLCTPRPLRASLARDYKALVEYSWHEELLRRGARPTCFNTRIGAIRREVFEAVGGFDERYRRAEVEDYEFSYRLPADAGIVLRGDVLVRHDFPGLWGTVRAYWDRGAKWAVLFARRRAFDSGGTSATNALGHTLGALLPVLLVLAVWSPVAWWLCAACAAAFQVVYRRFFAVVVRCRGATFLPVAALLHVLYSGVIVLACARGLVLGLRRGNNVRASSAGGAVGHRREER